jgi:hypothetical protein
LFFGVVDLGGYGGTARYSVFDSALYNRKDARWQFSQEIATSLDLTTPTSESKTL